MKSIISGSVASLAVIFLFISCNKIDTTDLGSGLIPEIDNVNTFDTILPVTSDNFFSSEDSRKMIYSQAHGIGIIDNDAEFGTTSVHLYTAFAPSASHSYPFVKRDTVKIDSVVLSLAYSSQYGDSTSVQQFEVKEISRVFDFQDTAYTITNPDFPVEPEVIGSKAVTFYTLNDNVQYRNAKDTVNTANELRIRLDTAWARRFVAYDTTASGAYNNDSLFQTQFRGIEVRATEASTKKKGIAYFDLTQNERTRITFYCRVQVNGRTDTIAPYFVYKTRMPEASIVRRTPGGNYLANMSNGMPNDERIYMQGTPGAYATISIPGLSGIPNCVIHRAELIMEKSPSLEESSYPPPSKLFIEALSGDTVATIRNDFIFTNSSGGYDITSLGGSYAKDRYVFNLTRYVQSIVTKGYRNYTLKVSNPFVTTPNFTNSLDVITTDTIPLIINPQLGGGRVVLYGGGYTDTAKAMRMRIIYSKI
ncbi:MAG: DUF4270 family protein [Chitinophagaceae bacterium]|nr:DUF4270 family protein [Chitinophagaceae bacterium]